jgi:hypothetical protein
MISSSVVSFSLARSKITISLVIFPAFRNRSCIRRNNRAEKVVFTIKSISDGNLGRIIIGKTLLRLNK